MAGGARRRGMITEINVTPLVDIVLVLLIVFMLTANLIARQAIEVDLPQAATGSSPSGRTMAVTVTRDGVLYLDGQPTEAASLTSEIRTAVAADAKTTVLIAGDKGVAHGRVVWLLDLVRSLGVTRFAIQIDPAARVGPDQAGPPQP